MIALETAGLHSYYGESHVLHGVDLQVEEGKVTSLLGRNGVGKTTLIRTIIGFTRARAGTVTLRGRSIERMPSHAICRLGVGLVPQGRRIFRSLTVQEQLELPLAWKAKGPWDLDAVYALFPRLRERRHNLGSQLSGGEQSMVAVARALMTNPTLLMMDEPSEGLAPVVIQELERTFRKLKESGLTVLLVEQNLALALSLADTVYVMSKGSVVHHASAEEFAEAYDVRRQHLGV
jgi:branched-chain amino acid transport system ATP-binding protein